MSRAGRPSPRDSRAHAYDAVYATVPNWDVGRPQRAFVHLEEAGLVREPVLDVGCGTGELSLFLARRGYDVLGIDISPRAVEQARSKARWRRIDAEFLVWDALDLAELAEAGLSFRTVVDSAMFHQFGDDERRRFIDGLGSVVPAGGLYAVLGDARSSTRPTYGISPAELRERFQSRTGWTVEFVVETVFERRHGRNRAYFAGVRRRSG
ncbi:class I SAM-dependent methyltransferase [halophilic archaeon]|nr:class I SAM-dependent methyltransferase [halophilic archaeon]